MNFNVFAEIITVFYAVFCLKNVIESDLIVTPKFGDLKEILLHKSLI